jgi:sulfatase maturation enzyme AslB (radical SAM superfamily)
MNLSINPTYYCNFRCDFCYLTPEQLGDRNKIDLDVLDQRLSEVPHINHVDLYGGEVGLLKPDYFYAMKDIIRKYYDDEININTNLSAFPDFFRDD